MRLARGRGRADLRIGAGQVDGDIGPPAQALAAIVKANGRVLAASDYVTFARSDDPGFVARLYAAGALLVLDAEQAGGCSGLPPNPQRHCERSEAIHSSRHLRKLDCFVLRSAQ